MRSSTSPRSRWTSTRQTTWPRCVPRGCSVRAPRRRWRRRRPLGRDRRPLVGRRGRARCRRRLAVACEFAGELVITALALRGLPEVRPGDDLAALIAGLDVPLRDGDVLAGAHKDVSQAEGRVVAPSRRAPGETAPPIRRAAWKA